MEASASTSSCFTARILPPQGDVPGEWYSPTQPFATKPPPYDRNGVASDDLIDFTPELRAEAISKALSMDDCRLTIERRLAVS